MGQITGECDLIGIFCVDGFGDPVEDLRSVLVAPVALPRQKAEATLGRELADRDALERGEVGIRQMNEAHGSQAMARNTSPILSICSSVWAALTLQRSSAVPSGEAGGRIRLV